MRIVFLGTPNWAVPSLEILLTSHHDIVAVVTNPDRPAGRGYEMHAPPVKERALAAALPVLQPESARDRGFAAWFAAQEPDVAVVVAYGKILPASVLDLAPHGFLNVHFSLLPSYRGAAPVQRAVMDGLEETGVTIMRLTPGMDEGPVLASRTVPIDADETAGALGERLAREGAELLGQVIDPYLKGELEPQEQDHERATYAPKISTEEARIDWSVSAEEIRNKVRGLNPAPGAWTTLGGTRMKIHGVELSERASAAPGTLEIDDRGELLVGTGGGGLILKEVQVAGKRRMTGAELARGLRPDQELKLG